MPRNLCISQGWVETPSEPALGGTPDHLDWGLIHHGSIERQVTGWLGAHLLHDVVVVGPNITRWQDSPVTTSLVPCVPQVPISLRFSHVLDTLDSGPFEDEGYDGRSDR